VNTRVFNESVAEISSGFFLCKTDKKNPSFSFEKEGFCMSSTEMTF